MFAARQIANNMSPMAKKLYLYFFAFSIISRTQGSRPRSRTQKNPRPRPRTALPRTDPLKAKDSGASVLQKKRSSKFFFRQSPEKNVFQKFFFGDVQNFNNSKNTAVLEPKTGQFSRKWAFEAKAKDLICEAKDFKMCPRGCLWGQRRP